MESEDSLYQKPNQNHEQTPNQLSLVGRLMWFCLHHKLIVGLIAAMAFFVGVLVAPFDWDIDGVQRYPVAVDAIPDIGENQQIVFTEWMGRSPQDVEDQITYPLTVSLLGIPSVKTVRSYSMFGFSTIYIIFKEDAEFYWSRTRVLEKINSLPSGTLPEGVQPTLGPDATALGQVYWYTLEGRDPDGVVTGGWGVDELRSTQDWYARYWLLSADGVAEVASIGGHVKEYQIDVDPDAMRAYGVSIEDVFKAVRAANIDVGAKTVEINQAEYFIRGVGFIKSIEDIENSVIKLRGKDIPVLVKNVASVSLGPAGRRGALDKGGAPAVGGVVVARYGDNPLEVINHVKQKIKETAHSLPSKAIIDFDKTAPNQIREFAKANDFVAYDGAKINQDAWLGYLQNNPREEWPEWITKSTVTVVPFYDRTGLIYETLETLNEAILQEILITVIVVLVMVMHLRSSIIVSAMLPLAVLLSFIGMKLFNIQANIVALSGIAIAIGTIVDMGIVICENILRHLDKADPDESRINVVHRASSEVGSAVLTAVLTTVVSFLPVFTMTGAEGKLFTPLAYTKTFALIASVVIALTLLPPAAHILFCGRIKTRIMSQALNIFLAVIGIVIAVYFSIAGGLLIVAFALYRAFENKLPAIAKNWALKLVSILAVAIVGTMLTLDWEPLGTELGLVKNLIFVGGLIAGLLGFFKIFQRIYPKLLRWCLDHKLIFLSVPSALLIFSVVIWLGFAKTFSWMPENMVRTESYQKVAHWFPGLGKEFMPDLDEGSFLFMPTTMPHASIGEALDVLEKQDMAFASIPEIDSVVGKLGRAETPLDPAPISMIETVINYKSEYISDEKGKKLRFKYDESKGDFVRDETGNIIPDSNGRPFRQWRDHITSADDIWDEIVKVAKIPGTTSAPKLQPIAARIVMLQSGMRAPMGVKVKGPTLESIENAGLQIEGLLKQVPSIEDATVVADRIVGKPYLEIVPNRQELARHGISIRKFHDVVEMAIGGKQVTTTLEGRERYPVRVRYQRELRDSIESMSRILVAGEGGMQIPIAELAEIRYVRGPQMIKSEDTFLVGYVVFDKKPGYAEVDVVEQTQNFLQHKIETGELNIESGVSYEFAGSYENQIRASKTLAIVLPFALFLIFMLIYMQFRSVSTTFLIFTGVFVAWSGGFLMLWLYGQPWFMNFAVFDVSIRQLFQMDVINMSVAVWVGFLALFGIATDDGVVMGTYLVQLYRERNPKSKTDIRDLVVEAGTRRVRACLMTTATTILALLPIFTSTGRGSEIMVPMAIPSFGGMFIAVMTMLVVPVLYSLTKELKMTAREKIEQHELKYQ